jgi:hypothetical protein
VPIGVCAAHEAFFSQDKNNQSTRTREEMIMSTMATKDGMQIFDKDWGTGQPVPFPHGWPLTSGVQIVSWASAAIALPPTTGAGVAAPAGRQPHRLLWMQWPLELRLTPINRA